VSRPLILIGAGGHAKVVAQAWRRAGGVLAAYVDRAAASWPNVRHVADDAQAMALAAEADFALAFVGRTPADLARRTALFRRYVAAGCRFPPIVDPTASVASECALEAGVQVLAGAAVNPGARIGEAAVINTRAVTEHDAAVAAGAHIAPGATVLGAATVGAHCVIGANAVVLPGAGVPADTLVPALSRFPK
jgi:sugar O-acyltransferase (sialic acid O-acetyltransferase NeuD family)